RHHEIGSHPAVGRCNDLTLLSGLYALRVRRTSLDISLPYRVRRSFRPSSSSVRVTVTSYWLIRTKVLRFRALSASPSHEVSNKCRVARAKQSPDFLFCSFPVLSPIRQQRINPSRSFATNNFCSIRKHRTIS
uniref:Uncharacterized protein n=1 Tax=Ciona intestinalis TaxID=7719 RepID=H2XWG1_CIOIN